MGFPHETVTVPGWWPDLVSELVPVAGEPLADELLTGLRGGDATPGHVCATAFVVSPDHRHLLLVHHPRLGWSNPGGHVEPGESTAQAADRELAEEAGLTGADVVRLPWPVGVHVTDVEARPGEPAHRHWNVAWAFVADRSAPLTAESVDGTTRELRWFDVDDLPTDDAAADLVPTWATVRARLR